MSPSQTPAGDSEQRVDAAWSRCAGRLVVFVHFLMRDELRRSFPPEDVVQEVALRAWPRVQTMDLSAPSTYCYLASVARSIVVDLARAASAARRGKGAVVRLGSRSSAAMNAHAPGAVTAPGVPTAVNTHEGVSRVIGALETLAPHKREAVLLHFFAGLPFRDVAARLGVPQTTAFDLFRSALAEMRGQLGQQAP